ncbi:MAG: hypothetical protein ACPF9K_11630 [Neptuniibacter sp.]
MRKFVIAGAAIVAGTAGYMVLQEGDSTPETATATNPAVVLLESIPADTVVFSGQLEPFPLKNYLKNTTYSQAQMPPELTYELEKDGNPQGLFLSSLIGSYFTASQSGEAFQKTFGLKDEFLGAFYMVGVLPVLKYQTSDPQAIWRLFDKAEQDSGFTHQVKQLNGHDYRAYKFELENEQSLELVVSQQGDWVSITINGQLIGTEDLKLALGFEKPETSLQASGKVQSIQSHHNFLPNSIAYIDHQELVTAFTSKEGNNLARMISNLVGANGKTNELKQLHSAECQKEMAEIAATWPRTVVGMRDMQIDENRSYVKASMIVESSNSTLMGALATMQGYLPSYLNQAPVFGFGLGLDANKINPALSTIWSSVLNTEYSCAPLMQMQASLKQSNPAALAMFTGMVQGVKGVGVAMNDFSVDMDGPTPDIKGVDALLSLSADNPEVLFNMAKTFAPNLASIQLPTDGSPVDLSAYIPNPKADQVQPMLALKGQHLVVYTGEKSKAMADALASETPQNNGVMSLSADYSRLFTPLVPLMEMNATPEVADQFQILKDLNMKISMKISFSDQGIEMATEADMKASENT